MTETRVIFIPKDVAKLTRKVSYLCSTCEFENKAHVQLKISEARENNSLRTYTTITHDLEHRLPKRITLKLYQLICSIESIRRVLIYLRFIRRYLTYKSHTELSYIFYLRVRVSYITIENSVSVFSTVCGFKKFQQLSEIFEHIIGFQYCLYSLSSNY